MPSGAALVTADGAVDTTLDPNNQELLTASIHYCELVAALGLLAPGGNFLLKAFTLYEHTSFAILHLMAATFHRVAVFKPAASKPANSEVYIAGLGFRARPPQALLTALLSHCGLDAFATHAMCALEDMPPDFVASVCRAAKAFGRCACLFFAQCLCGADIVWPGLCGSSMPCLHWHPRP